MNTDGCVFVDKEFVILEQIAESNNITQRKLAEKTGLSLGASNILVKRLIKKGFVKVEQINSRTLRYILTPAGIVEKTKRTYEYIVHSYNYIANLNNKIKYILKQQENCRDIFLYGIKDEIYSIVQNALNEMGLKASIIDRKQMYELDSSDYFVILVWDYECENELKEKGYPYINILENS